MLRSLALLAGLACLALVAPAHAQNVLPSFDCAKASTTLEHAICADDTLAKIDADLAAIYAEALAHIDELCAPYATVIDINRAKLPTAAEVNGWTSEQFVRALRHNQADPLFNVSLRQLIHVGFKVAAKMGTRYLKLLEECEASVSRNVTTNLFERHIKPLFLDR